MEFEVSKLDNLSERQIGLLYRYNLCTETFGTHGSGILDFLEARRINSSYDSLGSCIFAFQDGYLIGWAAFWQSGRVWVYVLPELRRQGFGSLLIEKVKQEQEIKLVQPWDNRSTKFFLANNLSCFSTP